MKSILTLFICCFSALLLVAQDDAPKGPWTRNVSLGLDFAQLLQINPKQGAGENRIGLGGAVNYGANYKAGRKAWDNAIVWQYGMQRLGSGLIAGSTEKKPFQKSIDEFKFSSKYGYAIKEGSKWFYTADLGLITQLTNTFKGNLLTDTAKIATDPISKLLSPGRLNFAIGIDYKPNDKLSFFYSPIGYQGIYVLADEIANDVVKSATDDILGSVHGNEIEISADKKTLLEAKKASHQIGSILKGKYTNKFAKDRILFTSDLSLFSDYLNNPQNIDVIWNNEIGFSIYKGLTLSLLLNAFYDHDVFVQISDSDAVNGVSGLGRRISLTQQILAKYNVVF